MSYMDKSIKELPRSHRRFWLILTLPIAVFVHLVAALLFAFAEFAEDFWEIWHE